jgi:type I restriction enzyme S subunit
MDKQIKLSALCVISSSKRIFSKEYKERGVPFFRGKEITEKYNGKLNVSTELFITEEKFLELESKFGVPQQGDMLLTSVGTLGSTYIVKPNDRFYFKDGNLTWFKDFKGLDSQYLKYWLESPVGKGELRKSEIGSSQSAYTISNLKEMQIELPSIDIQLTVVDFIKKYDNLIENNNRRVAILEDMAQSLYREWFVNFRYPSYADELGASSTNALNENQGKPKLIDSPLGQIPEGWEVCKLENTASMKYGKMSKKDLRCEEGIPIYSGYKITGYYPEANLNESKVIVVARGVGGTGDVKMSPDKCWLTNLSIYIMENEKRLKKAYLFYQLKFANLRSLDSGTSISQITIADLSKFKIIVPSIAIQEKFEGICNTFWSQIKVLTKQNKNLKKQRDMLLPKLISGQIELKD